MSLINKNFHPKRPKDDRLPPGQYETKQFPVLSLGPTPDVSLADWKLEVFGLADDISWTWQEFQSLPMTTWTKDIHCVTKWSKFDTVWEGVLFDEIVQRAYVSDIATHVVAHSFDGYSTNIPLEDLTQGKAMIAIRYDGEPLEEEHGGPARLVVPHLYFWKSAKWLAKLEFTDYDSPGFWETRGYHNYGDPWKEERYTFD